MIRSPRAGIRLTFLARFVIITFGLYVVVAGSLAWFLIGYHETAVESNEAVNAAGELSALATTPLGLVGRDDRVSPQALARFRRLEDAAKRLQYVANLRIYGTDGRALFPQTAQADPAYVRHTLQIDDLWSRDVVAPDGESLRTEYVPFASPTAIFVLEIDLSRDGMRAQAGDEARGVVLATGMAIGLVLISLVALAAGASREIERRRRESENTFVQTLGVLADALDRRDAYTAGHSRRVATYSALLATELGLTPRERDIIENAALLHDLGKVGIPDAILLKPGKLDDRERSIMTTHPRIGSEIIAGVATMEDIAPCVLHHHERLDGKGYPDGLTRGDIPRGSRVIAVADTFDAMTTDRPYRAALSVEEAVSEMRRVSGTQLEGAYVEAFVRIIERGRVVPPIQPSSFVPTGDSVEQDIEPLVAVALG